MIREGAIRGYLLFADDQPTAFVLGSIKNKHIYLFDYNGFEPDYKKWSPGIVLQYKIIEHLFCDPAIDLYDLCTGDREHKRIFSSDTAPCGIVCFFQPKVGIILVLLSDLIIHKISRVITYILDRLNLKNMIKKMLEAGAG